MNAKNLSAERLSVRSGRHPLGNWHLNTRGYPRFHSGDFRSQYVHRAVFQFIAGRQIKPGYTIHHQNFNKLCFCPENLIEMPEAMNVQGNLGLRCPYTGVFLSKDEWERRMGTEAK